MLQAISLASFLLITCLCSHAYGTVVALNTNYDDQYSCPNTLAVINCTTDTGFLAWYVPDGNNQGYNTGDGTDNSHPVGLFTAQLISESGNTLFSRVHINVNSTTNGSSIECRDSFTGNNYDVKTAVINIATAPSAPLNFINTSMTYDTVVLSWSEPGSLGGVPIDQYIITSSPTLQYTCSQCNTTNTNATISGLQHNTAYTFNISASNCAGVGESQSLSVNTVATEPNPPTDLKACMISTSEVRVTWNCPATMSKLSPPITEYTVTLSSPGLQTETSSIPHSGCTCPYSLTLGVQSGSYMYTVSVVATNIIGNSANGPYTSIYTTPNITADSVLVTTGTAVIAVNVSWSTCHGITGELEVGHSFNGQSDSRSHMVTLPLRDALYIPLEGLEEDSFYSSNIRLHINGSGLQQEITGPSFNTMKELQCNSGVRVTETVIMATSSNTVNGQQQCTNERNLYLGIGVLGSVAAIAVIAVIVIGCLLVFKKRSSNKQTVDANLQLEPSPHPLSQRYSDFHSFNNSQSHLISTTPRVITPVSPTPFMTSMTPNDSYGHRPPQPLPQDEPSEYAEITNYSNGITNNPTYMQVPLDHDEKNEQYPVDDTNLKMSPSPPSSPPPPRGEVNNPAYGKTGPSNRYEEQPNGGTQSTENSDVYI